MAYDSNAARKGQAFNLAVRDAISKGQENSPAYIYKKFVYYLSLADAVQGSDTEMLLEVINNKDFDKIIKDLETLLKKE